MAQKLTKTIVKGYIDAGKAVDVADTQAPGLVLRVRPSGHSGFCVRRQVHRKEQRMTLDAVFDLDDARDIANEVDRRIREKRDPWYVGESDWSAWYNRRLREKRGLPALPDASLSKKPDTGPLLSFHDGMNEYLAKLLTTHREDTVHSYRRALNVAEVKPLHFKFVASVTRQDVAEAVQAIFDRGKERQAETTLTAIKMMFAFLGDDARSRRTGVVKGRFADMEPPERPQSAEDEEHNAETQLVPPVDETVPKGPDVAIIVRSLRSEDSPIPERDRLAALFTIFTVQRRRTVAAARMCDFLRVGDIWVWQIPPLHRKTASIRARKKKKHSDGTKVGTHIIPLMGDAEAVFLRARELAGDSPHLFPAVRARRAGMPVSHIDPSTITHAFSKIPGNTFSPHDMRRAYGTSYAQVAGMTTEACKPVLDHGEGLQYGDVTAEHYSFLSNTNAKIPQLKGYVNWIEAHIKNPPDETNA
jgi:integrase